MITKQLNHKACVTMLKEEETPRNIYLHSRKVNAIAMFIAKKLIEKGEKIDLYLVDMGSMLHDISKYKEVKYGNTLARHTFEAYNTLIVKGYPIVARIALRHGLDEVLCKKYGLKTWEEIIVYYADKRVNHDKVVSLDERLKYLKETYGINSKRSMEKIKAVEKPLKELEKQIFKNLDLNPEDIDEKSVKLYLIRDEY